MNGDYVLLTENNLLHILDGWRQIYEIESFGRYVIYFNQI